MERLLRAADIMTRYQCSAPTARAYMRKMIHTENPLTVTEGALMAWERERTHGPGETGKEKNAVKRRRMPRMIPAGDYRIPRRRA